MKIDAEKVSVQLGRKRLSLGDLATRCDWSRSRVYAVLNSGRNVRPATAGKIAAALETDVSEIITHSKGGV